MVIILEPKHHHLNYFSLIHFVELHLIMKVDDENDEDDDDKEEGNLREKSMFNFE